VIRAEGDADLDIVRTAVSMTSENYHTHRYGHGFVSATASLRITQRWYKALLPLR